MDPPRFEPATSRSTDQHLSTWANEAAEAVLQFFGDKPQFNWTTKVKSAEVGGEKNPKQNKKACVCVCVVARRGKAEGTRKRPTWDKCAGWESYGRVTIELVVKVMLLETICKDDF